MVDGGLRIGAIIPPLVASVIGILKIVEFKSKMSDIGDNPFAEALKSTVAIDYGLYLMVVAGLVLPVLAFAIRDESAEVDLTAQENPENVGNADNI